MSWGPLESERDTLCARVAELEASCQNLRGALIAERIIYEAGAELLERTHLLEEVAETARRFCSGYPQIRDRLAALDAHDRGVK